MAVAIAGTPVSSSLSAGTTLVASLPSGITSGELLCLVVSTTFDVAITTPSGWTAETAVGDGFGSGRLALFRKAATGSEGASVNITVGSCDASSLAWRVTGHDTTTPINVSATNSGTSGSGTAITCPSVTTTATNCMVVRLGSCNEAAALTIPGSNTLIVAGSSGSGALNNSSSSAYAMQAATGASGTANFVATTGNRPWQAITFAIAPAASTTVYGLPLRSAVVKGAPL